MFIQRILLKSECYPGLTHTIKAPCSFFFDEIEWFEPYSDGNTGKNYYNSCKLGLRSGKVFELVPSYEDMVKVFDALMGGVADAI